MRRNQHADSGHDGAAEIGFVARSSEVRAEGLCAFQVFALGRYSRRFRVQEGWAGPFLADQLDEARHLARRMTRRGPLIRLWGWDRGAFERRAAALAAASAVQRLT